jgi:hypothetical protein
MQVLHLSRIFLLKHEQDLSGLEAIDEYFLNCGCLHLIRSKEDVTDETGCN